MPQLSFSQFDQIYQDSVTTVFRHWTPEMQSILAAHCHSWGPGLFDFRNYLQASSCRFYKAYLSFAAGSDDQTICDVGGFWGVFPLTLKKIGYEVSMTESLQYYGESFTALFECIVDNGVQIFDYDPFAPEASLKKSFDVITVMAVLEHYPHSLKQFMENVCSLLAPDGRIYIEVPNVAYWPKRVGLMKGQTPHAQLKEVFLSDVPFIGHHHELTISELRDLAKLSGLAILREDFYNYTPGSHRNLWMLLRSPFQFLAFSLIKESRECLTILCKLETGNNPKIN
jgi:2-polyprenyl-3-methyl-5-hydroxy-6-metoxy-1,4-benzoquinol methylase